MLARDRQKPPPGALYLDHVSHFVADLDAAAQCCEALGLAVTPLSVQQADGRPAGASNRCVMLEAGYLEILSPTHDTPVAERMRALMRRYTGVHLVCFGTPDAEGEHRRLAAHGFAPQPIVDLSREVDGGTARFKVVRTAPEQMPEGRVQFVEHRTPEHLWRPEHVNALHLQEVFVVADDPVEAAARWARFTALLPRPEGDTVRLETDRGAVVIATQRTIAAILGNAPPPPAIAGYTLGCIDATGFLEQCKAAGLEVSGRAVRLPPALGGGWAVIAAS